MKTRILLTAIIAMSLTFNTKATDDGRSYEREYQYGNQGVVVNRYYFENGYEYASRINRFHRTYVSFDFYSPLYTDIFWYNYTPYTWGVSIYDDWYYYGAGASRYAWMSGFGGSYWWGYDPWLDYNPWMGYGWSSWYNPGISFSVNFYLGRPHNHYPVAYNNWYHHQHNVWRPVYNVHNNYYTTNNTYNYSSNKGYNPSHPYNTDRRPGYTEVNRRSSTYVRPAVNQGENQVAKPSDNQGRRSSGNENARPGNTNTDNSGSNANQSGNDRDRTNNGLRMGQYRRGVAEPSGTKPNTPERPNNPNVNDRTNPGRENTDDATGKVNNNQGNDNPSGNDRGELNRGNSRTRTQGAPVEAKPRQETQTNVKTNTQRRETTMSQGSSRTSSQPKETVSRKSVKTSSEKSGDNTSSKEESTRRSSSSRGR